VSHSPAIRIVSAWEEPLERGNLRYRDARFGMEAVKLLPGDYFATRDGLMLVTVLGSCVAACLHDPEAGAGGMNHFMLPDTELGVATVSARYGSYAMEVLINDLMKLGARRACLQAKIFGGCSVLSAATSINVAERNIAFVRAYLAAEQIPVLAEDLGGDSPRVVNYFPQSGRALVKRLQPINLRKELAAERAYSSRLTSRPETVQSGGDIELFD
jgi:chemotaxis protein CheD